MLAIANDHALGLKKTVIDYLNAHKIAYKDFGVNTADSVDYPDYAAKACKAVLSGECDKAVLICGTGIGMSIAANRYRGIRAAVCTDTFSAKMSRAHNDANILCLGARIISIELAVEILNIFLTTRFEGGRHKIRVDKIEL